MSATSTRLERYFNRVWYSKNKPPLLLRLLSSAYGAWMQKSRPIQTTKTSIPIVVVGNVVVGGVGKTPVVATLSKHLMGLGYQVAVISRGHGARRGNKQPVRVTAASLPEEVGDEPVMLASISGVKVVVCIDRAAALEEAMAWGAEVVIADDGLQHARLARSYQICVTDGTRGFGNGYLLPAGPLRLKQDQWPKFDQFLVKGGTFKPNFPYTRFDLCPLSWRSLRSSERFSIDRFAGQSMAAMCAIGNPEGFETMLASLGVYPKLTVFPDHHRYHQRDFQALDPVLPIAVTEKDAVKIQALGLDQKLIDRIYVLVVEANLPESLLTAVDLHVKGFNA